MSEYRLPFPEDVKSISSRPPQGRYAHENWPKDRYALDFIMPLGTPILASRGGEVVVAEYDSDRCISNLEELNKLAMEEIQDFAREYTNGVYIVHEDNTYAEYIHLDKRPVVEVGQIVKQGDLIGYCGMSGITTEPHLHFNLLRVKKNLELISIPFEFE